MILLDLSFTLPKPEVRIVSSSNILSFIFITGSKRFLYTKGVMLYTILKSCFQSLHFDVNNFDMFVGNFKVLLTILHQNQNPTNGLKPFECQQ